MSPSHAGVQVYKEEGMAIPGTMVSSYRSSLVDIGTAVEIPRPEDLLQEAKQASCPSARTKIRHVKLFGVGPPTS